MGRYNLLMANKFKKSVIILSLWIVLTIVVMIYYQNANMRFVIDIANSKREDKTAMQSIHDTQTPSKSFKAVVELLLNATQSSPTSSRASTTFDRTSEKSTPSSSNAFNGTTDTTPGTTAQLMLLNSYNETTIDDGCQGFNNDPRHPTIVKYFKPQKTISCKGGYPNLLYADKMGERLIFDKEKAEKQGINVDYCHFASLTRILGNDFATTTSKWSKAFTESITIPSHVDHFLGQCISGNTLVGHGYISIIRVNKEKEKIYEERFNQHVAKNKPKETLSIMMIGIDGTSKQNFARQMPKTRDYLLKNMAAIEMRKLNKVGLNTFPNIIPLLTGKNESEIRQNWTDKTFFDNIDHEFLWSDAHKNGHRTAMMLDRRQITAFHYLKKGWNNPPFDYYNRPVILSAYKNSLIRKVSDYCIGDRPEISVLYDYWLQMAATLNNKTKPYFGFSFFAHLTHDYINLANSADEVYLELLHKFMDHSLLNNTLLVFFSDHGFRFGEFRSTVRGMHEDNNPFMLFVFPPWFKEKYPKIMDNFHKNQHRLITNFNVHATLKDILNFQGDDIAKREVPTSRDISLFQELPKKRTCEEAGIPLKFCNCQTRQSIEVYSDVSLRLSKSFLDHVVSKTNKLRDKCEVLTLNATISVLTMYTPASKYNLYQVTIKTMPGGALYEVALIQYITSNDISVVGDVDRVNMYRGQADCVDDARIRPFCYCRNLLNTQL